MTKDQEIADLKQSLAWAQQQKTLRDEFAMAAITGVMDKYKTILSELIAKDAYAVADEMMKERHK